MKTSITVLLTCFLLTPFAKIFAQQTTFSSGAYIVNMGVVPQTMGNGLKPYGLVYELVKNYDVPVYWIINPNKLKDGTDFTYNGTAYKGGPFIIAAENRNATIDSRIAYWAGLGVIGVTTTSSITVPVAQKITAVPRWTLDAKSGAIAQNYIVNAGIPEANSNWDEPYMLNNCNDIFVLPHADPNWNTHGPLYDWNLTNRGSIWVSCHAGSTLENSFNATTPSQQLNFLALNSAGPGSNSLIDFRAHNNGSVPYNNNSYPAEQVMQFIGPIDGAVSNGSESIYVPKLGGGWRPTTKVGVYDPTMPDVPSLSPGKAALLAWGRGMGNNNRGWVMYEAGHNHTGNSPDNIAAQRAFLNFSFMATLEKSMNISVTGIQSVMINAGVYALSATVTQNIPTGPYTYQWSSSCGGTFTNPTAANTNYTPPTVVNPTNCTITLKVTDACGRTRIFTQNFLITSGPRPPVASPDSLTFSPDCVNINPVITISPLTNDVEPDGQPMTITNVTGNNGAWSINPDQSVQFLPNTGFYGIATATYTVCDNTTPTPLCAASTIKINITSASTPPTAVDDDYTIYEDSINVFYVLANDIPGSGSPKISGIPVMPKYGKVSININNTISYLPNADFFGYDTLYYKISSTGGYQSTARVTIAIRHDCCPPGNYKKILGPVYTTSQSLIATDDSYGTLKNPNNNYGTATTITCDRETTDKQVGYLNFDISELLCYATLVRNASLKLYKTAGADQYIELYRLLNPWDESQVTWNKRLTTNNWTLSGGDYNKDSLIDQITTGTSNIWTWNMNVIMQKMVCNSTLYPNFGFIMRAQCSGEPNSGCGDRTTLFATKENTSGYLKPTLQITFDSAAFLCVPIPVRPPLAMPDTASTRSNASVLINVSANDWLPAGNTGTISILTGTVTTGTTSMSGNNILYQPTLTFNGYTSFQYVITDNTTGMKDTANVFVYVSYPPPIANDDSVTIFSGSSGAKNLITNDIDLVGLGLNFAIISGPKYGTYSVSGTTVTYTAPFNFYGRDSIPYKITNAGTGACNENLASDTAYFIIIVNNRPPVAVNDSDTTNPCQQIIFDVLKNDSDPEGGNLSINSVSAVSPAGAGTAAISGFYIVFTPNPAYAGTSASFTYTIQDDAVPPAVSSPATVTVNLYNIPNLPPVAINDTADGLMNTPIYIPVKDNDSDPEDDPLTVNFSGVLLAPSHGSVSVLANGLVVYTPANNYSGVDYFQYRLNDSHAGISGGVCTNVSLSSVATVYVVIRVAFIVLSNSFQDLKGISLGKKNRLSWTVQEIKGNADYFIERSEDNLHFSVIGQIKKANAAITGINTYEFYDEAPYANISFYRIRFAGDNGASLYSNTIVLKNNEEAVTLQTYPVPFTNKLNVKFNLPNAQTVNINMVSPEGKMLKSISVPCTRGMNNIPLTDLESIKPGMYFIRVDINNEILINKAIKLQH